MTPLERYLAVPEGDRNNCEIVDWFSPESEFVHPNAKAVLTGEWVWDVVDESAPFGSDEGHEAFFGYLDWRVANPGIPIGPILNDWVYGIATSDEWDGSPAGATLQKLLADFKKGDFEDSYILWTAAQTAVTTALAQLIVEGEIEPEVKALATTAQDMIDELMPLTCDDDLYVQSVKEETVVIRTALAA